MHRHRRQHHYCLLSAISLLILQISCSSNNSSYNYYYNQCMPSTCGPSVLQYPFGQNPICRSPNVTTLCENNTLLITNDQDPHMEYKLLQNLTKEVYARRLIRVVDVSVLGCGTIPDNGYDHQKWGTLGVFRYTNDYRPVTFLNCTQELSNPLKVPCLECGDDHNFCYFTDEIMDSEPTKYCSSFTTAIPFNVYYNLSAVRNIRRVLQGGFTMEWDDGNCDPCRMEIDGGRCGYLNDGEKKSGEEVCFCNDGVHKHNCSDGLLVELDGVAKRGHGFRCHTRQVIIALGLGAGLMAFICMGYFYLKKRWSQINDQDDFGGEDDKALRRYLGGDKTIPASIETFLQNYTLGRPTRFSYKQLKRFTTNFTHKLGQGGYGSVFKGELPNGLFIAVKLLNDTDQSEAQFLNEVQIIGHIHHNHLVRLLGYCFEPSRQVLVYEFMENGSLDKYIHAAGDGQKTTEKLSWSQLHDIAVGTAKGIMYLHEECRTRIIHCDIKPHNILLDRNFRPKVSDFGLALVMNRDKSHVSLSHGAGTPGYAPPEIWWMNCGMISEKSDVYSFGMVMLEMAGRRRNLMTDVSSSSEMYFSEWVLLHNAEKNSSSSSEERGMKERMELVALWCIQFEQSMRPSMRRVIEMLEGDVMIEIPPSTIQSTHLIKHLSGEQLEVQDSMENLK
ncbi:rust resistance kinase Lr10-like [Macadamia integrifolia]|uniref:rust resistance kinase Lr10-like n=1 Tax=Macadamia integrifolia TaxID=60698 RepID=UPI001C4F07FE|nr:rust resistance kinase Lr10-like [Macadamia integrifolia]